MNALHLDLTMDFESGFRVALPKLDERRLPPHPLFISSNNEEKMRSFPFFLTDNSINVHSLPSVNNDSSTVNERQIRSTHFISFVSCRNVIIHRISFLVKYSTDRTSIYSSRLVFILNTHRYSLWFERHVHFMESFISTVVFYQCGSSVLRSYRSSTHRVRIKTTSNIEFDSNLSFADSKNFSSSPIDSLLDRL